MILTLGGMTRVNCIDSIAHLWTNTQITPGLKQEGSGIGRGRVSKFLLWKDVLNRNVETKRA